MATDPTDDVLQRRDTMLNRLAPGDGVLLGTNLPNTGTIWLARDGRRMRLLRWLPERESETSMQISNAELHFWPDGSFYSPNGTPGSDNYTWWRVGDATIKLNGHFTVQDLQAIIDQVKKHTP